MRMKLIFSDEGRFKGNDIFQWLLFLYSPLRLLAFMNEIWFHGNFSCYRVTFSSFICGRAPSPSLSLTLSTYLSPSLSLSVAAAATLLRSVFWFHMPCCDSSQRQSAFKCTLRCLLSVLTNHVSCVYFVYIEIVSNQQIKLKSRLKKQSVFISKWWQMTMYSHCTHIMLNVVFCLSAAFN